MFFSHAGTARRTSYKPAALVTAFAMAGVGVTALPASAVENDDGTVTIDVLGITDFHGRLQAGGGSAGAASLAGAIDAMREENPDSIFVSSGDSVGATTFVSAVQQDLPTLDVLNEMGLQVSAAGNHEFDRGAADFSGRIMAASEFPYLAANVDGVAGLRASDVVDVNGVRVGFIGAMTTALPTLVSPAGIEGVEVSDPIDAVRTEAERLMEADEADFIVVLAHEGFATSSEEDIAGDSAYAGFVRALQDVPAINAVMGGHTHIAYDHQIEDDFVATQAGQYGETLSKLSFTWNPETQSVTGVEAQNIALVNDEGAPRYEANAEVAAIVARAVTEAEELGAEVIGEATADIRRSVQPGADGAENRGGESTIGNLIADIQLAQTQRLETEVAFMNPGGIRADITAGDVTYEDAAVVQPFANTLTVMDLTGAQIRQALEQQWQPEGSSRPFLKLGVSEGLTYTYDPSAPMGQRLGEITLNGELLADDQVVRVVANSFLAAGGDNFTAFAQGTNRADSGVIDLDAMVNQVREVDSVSPPAEQRAVGITMPDVLVPGQSATIEVSSMAFAADPDLAGDTVTISIAGTQVGSAALDKSPTQASDETGRASVQILVPADAADGPVTLDISDGVTTVQVTGHVAGTDPVPVPDPTLFNWFFSGSLSGDPIEEGVDPLSFAPAEATAVLMGDWDGDGVQTPGYRIGNTFHLSNSLTSGEVDVTFAYGRATDLPMVGDWDGNGSDTIAVRRGNINYLKNSLAGGSADLEFSFGRATDLPMVGDWNGDGADTMGVRRGNINHLNDAHRSGQAYYEFGYGRATDVALIGDWNGDGRDTVAVRRGNEYFFTDALAAGNASEVTSFATAEDPLVFGAQVEADGPDTLVLLTPPVIVED